MSRKAILAIDFVGTKKWKDQCGRYHRLDGPAQEHICGDKYWYKHGKYIAAKLREQSKKAPVDQATEKGAR
jgi:hypothetical protein